MSSGKEFVSSSRTRSSSSSRSGSSIDNRYEAVASSTEYKFAECSLSCSNMHVTNLEHMSFSINGRWFEISLHHDTGLCFCRLGWWSSTDILIFFDAGAHDRRCAPVGLENCFHVVTLFSIEVTDWQSKGFSPVAVAADQVIEEDRI